MNDTTHPTATGSDPGLRHFVSYALYRVDPTWRRLPAAERERHKAELAALIESWGERIMVRTFSTVGLRADADLMIWRATPDLELLHRMQVDLQSTELGTWLEATYVYTATTKPSQYRGTTSDGGAPRRERPLDVVPVDRRYIIVYPFVKQRAWYALSAAERGEAMREHALVGRKYPNIKLNTAYSFGIDDQEFMVAFETDSVHDFLDLMMELRSTTASRYTERDTPIFTCLLATPREALDALGGVAGETGADARTAGGIAGEAHPGTEATVGTR